MEFLLKPENDVNRPDPISLVDLIDNKKEIDDLLDYFDFLIQNNEIASINDWLISNFKYAEKLDLGNLLCILSSLSFISSSLIGYGSFKEKLKEMAITSGNYDRMKSLFKYL